MAGLLASGTLFLDREIDGVAQGLVKIPGVAKFAITNNSEIKEQTSKDKGTYGQVTATVAIPQPSELSVTIANFDQTSMAMALMGDDVATSSGSGSVTDEAVTASLGKFVALANRSITSGSVVVTDSPMTTTYVEGTDYEVNYATGNISALSAGAIADAQALLVDYSYNAVSGFIINGATRPQVQGKLILDGKNLSTGRDLLVTVDRALLVSDGEVDFMADDFVEISMTGRMETLSGKTSPYTVESF